MLAVLLVSACSPAVQEKDKTGAQFVAQIGQDVSDDVRYVSETELSKHNYKTDCWVAVNGQVYDITRWIARDTDRLAHKDRENILSGQRDYSSDGVKPDYETFETVGYEYEFDEESEEMIPIRESYEERFPHYTGFDSFQRDVVRHCGTANNFEEEFSRTTNSVEKQRLFDSTYYIGELI